MVGITQISKVVSKKAGVTQKEAFLVIKYFIDEVLKNVDNGKKVNLVGFGIFERRKQKARKARNPKTKEIINIPEKYKLVFRASSKVKFK
ncbi:MAG: HU family DNA-binding protein [Thermoplasmata archaeon]